MKTKDYFIGLDLGTESTGWAATTCDYRLLKHRGQDLWGSHLFETAATAEDRRLHRSARRRSARVRNRLNLLQAAFKEEIEKVDFTFFLRLNNSKFLPEDKDNRINKTKYLLFEDDKFNDKDYFKKYPTIYHLRKDLINNPPSDIRLLYLAVHHILKNRGHFLFEGQKFDAADNAAVKGIFSEINNYLSERDTSLFSLESIDKALYVIKDRSLGKKAKQKQLTSLFAFQKNKQLSAIVSALSGGTVKLQELINAEDASSVEKFTFDDSAFEEKVFPVLESELQPEDLDLIKRLKSVYDWAVLSNILGEHKYISAAKVEMYDKHKKDLLWLKGYVKEHCRQKTNMVFRRQKGKDNYAAYIGMDQNKSYSKCTQEDFYKFLKKEVAITDASILAEMEKGSFMPKQLSGANCVIPYQTHLAELEKILYNAEKKFDFLKNEQGDGITVSQKILSLMTFRIPYYVGPLNTSSPFSWVVKREGWENAKITPWNFDLAIDKDASETKFITRMTNKCTYLPTEDVLPAASFLYSKFAFLNELNNLMISGEKRQEVNELVLEYAKTHKKVTLKSILTLLIKEGTLPKGSAKETVFSGLDGDFKNSLSSYVDFKRIIGDKADTMTEMCEDIIKCITIISDKGRLYSRIKSEYGKVLNDIEIKQLTALNYSQWGRLSRTLLSEITALDENTGEFLSIVDAMELTGNNFMQLLSNKHGYLNEIKEFNKTAADNTNVGFRAVEELYCSPSVKRSIWRSICVVNEIIKSQDGAPKKLFIEMARGEIVNQKGKRTTSRQKQLADLYANIKSEKRDWQNEILSTEPGKFNSNKILLYYRQMGRCMYTGEEISLYSLFNTNIYDIDHIYPQSKVKDDSLDNIVLAKRVVNIAKGDKFPISSDIRTKMHSFWDGLCEKGLISSTKFNKLIRSTPLTQDELSDFINRQLVETRQSTKAAAELFRKMLPNTEIVYSKAKNTSDFRHQFKLIKVRELNDLHHAKDAYINIVCGNVYNTKFGHNATYFFRKSGLTHYDVRNLFKKDLKDAWAVADIPKIKATYLKNTCKITRYTTTGKGGLFNATIKTAGANDNLIPLKANGPLTDTTKYGGYDSATNAYFFLVKSVGKKGKTLLSLERMPVYLAKLLGINPETTIDYCKNILKLESAEILIDKIKINTLLRIDGSYAYIRGTSAQTLLICNANQLYLDEKSTAYLKKVLKYLENNKKLRKEIPINAQFDEITKEENLQLYEVFYTKLSSKVYSGLPLAKHARYLKDKTDAFNALRAEEQCKVLAEVLRFMQVNSTTSDLSPLDGGHFVGNLSINKFIQDKDVQIIYESPTGIYKEVIDVGKYK